MADTSQKPATGFVQIVDKRDAATLVPIITAHVAPGTIVHSDGWASYSQVPYGTSHGTVNHSVCFVDPTKPHIGVLKCPTRELWLYALLASSSSEAECVPKTKIAAELDSLIVLQMRRNCAYLTIRYAMVRSTALVDCCDHSARAPSRVVRKPKSKAKTSPPTVAAPTAPAANTTACTRHYCTSHYQTSQPSPTGLTTPYFETQR
eukprot:Em0013g518a